MVMDTNEAPVKERVDGDSTSEAQTKNKKGQELKEEEMANNSRRLGEPEKAGENQNTDLPKNATDEWPAPKAIHMFWFPKFPPSDDPKLRLKRDQTDKEKQRRIVARQQIIASLKAKRAERSEVIAQLKPLTAEDKHFRAIMDEKKKEREPLQDALGKLRNPNNTGREKGVTLCTSVEELDSLIQQLQYRIQHESNTLAEEKQLLKEIKQLEGTRDKVVQNAAMKAKIQDSLGQKEAIEDQVKLIGADIDGVRKEKQSVRARIKQLEDQLKAIDEDISSMESELNAATEKRDKAFEMHNELRKSVEAANAHHHQYRNVIYKAKDLALKKDVAAIEEFCHNEMEKFMSEWNNNKAFRDHYEKNMLSSLDKREFSRDGRIRNPDEKPILSEPTVISKSEQEQPKPNVKHVKENEKATPETAAVPPKGVAEDTKKLKVEKKGKILEEANDSSAGVETSRRDVSQPNEIDAAKLKEMKREEEIAKAKQALERRRKLAEKAAAKAAARAQKEAEKKEKVKEKKARKKAGLVVPPPDEEAEADPVMEPQEEPEDKNPIPIAEKNIKEKVKVKQRNRSKVQDKQLQRIIHKKKKLQSYWLWAAPAIVMLLVLVAVGYYYSSGRISA